MSRFTDEPDQVRTAGLVFVLVLILLAVLALVAAVVRARRRTRVWVGATEGVEDPDAALPERLRAAVERAGAVLAEREGGPPGDAVVAAWLTLEQAAAREGTGRAPHQTPTEFTAALLGAYTSDEAALAELRELYQRARFGSADLTADDVRRARAALDRVLTPV